MLFSRKKMQMPAAEAALRGRAQPIPTANTHFVNGRPLKGPHPEGLESAIFGLGCFWGAERKFWQLGDGIWVTAAGYAGGYTPNPTYEEVCSGGTGHNEVVMVVFDPKVISYEQLLKIFWESHDPTQGMRQGNDVGTQYRSAIFTVNDRQKEIAEMARDSYQRALEERGLGEITTAIEDAGPFYYAEGPHQQYLDKVPNGYCGLAGTGVACQVPLTGGPA